MEDKWLVGVDLGGTTIKMAFINQEGEILQKWDIPTNKSGEGNNIPSDIAKSIDKKLRQVGGAKEQLRGIGIGAPGPVNSKDGTVYVAVNLGWEKNFPLRERLSFETSLPVVVDNDANVAALGEMWKGAGERAKNLLFVTLGTGVGGGIITNGEIVHGVNGAAGEIGHIASVTHGGVHCNCGKIGCLETVASATGVVRLAMKALQTSKTPSKLRDISELTSKQIFEAAKANDVLAIGVVNEFAYYLGFALANIANVINPEKIVIGGGVSKAGETLLKPLKEQLARFAFLRVAEGLEMKIATLGNDAGIFGAAWLAKTKLNSSY